MLDNESCLEKPSQPVYDAISPQAEQERAESPGTAQTEGKDSGKRTLAFLWCISNPSPWRLSEAVRGADPLAPGGAEKGICKMASG